MELHKNTPNLPLVVPTLQEAFLQASKISKTIFIAGGHNIYKECMDQGYCTELVVSRIKCNALEEYVEEGINEVVTFPEINDAEYELAHKIVYNAAFDIEIYRKPIEFYIEACENRFRN